MREEVLNLREEDRYLAFEAPLKTLKVNLTGKANFIDAVEKKLGIKSFHCDGCLRQGIQRLIVCGKSRMNEDYWFIARFAYSNNVQVLDLSQMEECETPYDKDCRYYPFEILEMFWKSDKKWKKDRDGNPIRSVLRLVLLPKPKKMPDYSTLKCPGFNFILDILNHAGFIYADGEEAFFGNISIPDYLEIKGLSIKPNMFYSILQPDSNTLKWKMQSVSFHEQIKSLFSGEKLWSSPKENEYLYFYQFAKSLGICSWHLRHSSFEFKIKLPNTCFG